MRTYTGLSSIFSGNKLSAMLTIGVLVLFFAGTSFAEDGDFVWARTIGGASTDQGLNIAVDQSGNTYTTGAFAGTVDFDPGSGTSNLTSSNNSEDIFVSKLDVNGNLAWAKALGGFSGDNGYSIAIDSSGNVYTTGYFQGIAADFDPGAGTYNLVSTGNFDIFISKLDSSGNFVWAKSIGSPLRDYGYSIAVDSSENVYITGSFQGTADFDPGATVNNLTSTGNEDIFVCKLDSSGNFVWAVAMGAANGDRGRSISVDSSGDVYITGQFIGTVDFDPGAGTFNLTSATSNYHDIFISKFDTDGNFLWAHALGGTVIDEGLDIFVDSSGNVFTTGLFSATVDFDPGAGTSTLTSVGQNDVFISKLDSSGNFIWAKSVGSTLNDYGFGIAVDTSGNVFTTGQFQGTADFDPGTGTFNLTSAGSNDIFILKLDSNGDFVWAKSMGSTTFDYGYDIGVDNSGNVFTTGFFNGTVDFDPGTGTSNLSSAGSTDIFIVKLAGSYTFPWNMYLPAIIGKKQAESFWRVVTRVTCPTPLTFTVTLEGTSRSSVMNPYDFEGTYSDWASTTPGAKKFNWQATCSSYPTGWSGSVTKTLKDGMKYLLSLQDGGGFPVVNILEY